MEQLTQEQIEFLNKVCKGTWKQTDKGINVNGQVNMAFCKLNKIPVKFYEIEGNFFCSCNILTSLEGCPEYVAKVFDCSDNNLISLEWSPEYVGGDFWCNHNKLTSLKGSPRYVGRNFYCHNNNLLSLEGCSDYIGGFFNCCNIIGEISKGLKQTKNKLTSLEGIGEVKGPIFCYNNKIYYKKEKELRSEIYKKIYLTTLEKMFVEC